MDNKKYQVFISSTYSDLIEERRKVIEVLLLAECIPAGMEAFVATDAKQFEVIKRVIDLCDYYVLIIGKRYGSISTETGISYTEMEYDYAIEKGIPVLVFALDESVDVPPEKMESDSLNDAKLKIFRDKALSSRMATIWHTSEELGEKLGIAIMRAKYEMPRPGWQRAADFDEASLRREIMQLQKTNEELNVKIVEKQKVIDSFMQQSDLAFDDCEITIEYSYIGYSKTGIRRIDGKRTEKLPELFKIISLEMLDASLSENAIITFLELQLFKDVDSKVAIDRQSVKIVLNQLNALGLIQTLGVGENNMLHWRLTAKGVKKRNDMTLMFNKQKY